MATVKRVKGEGFQQLAQMIQGMSNAQTKVGFVDSSKYDDGTPVAYVATIQEFGSPQQSIPARPFMRPTITRDSAKWKGTAASGAAAITRGSATTETVLNALGSSAAGGIKRSISAVTSPPLSPTTLRLRKLKREGVKIGGRVVGEAHKFANTEGANLGGVSTKPLVFDGILIGAVTHVVEKTT